MTLVPQQRTILFADISDSTALYEVLGDGQAVRVIDTVLSALEAVVDDNGGDVVKRIGDEIMAVFSHPEQASAAARIMQVQVAGSAPVSGIKLGIRVGFHHGLVLAEGGDYWGDCVNVASRLAGLAKTGQVYATAVTVDALPAALRLHWRDLSTLSVKGKQDPLQVFQLMWDDDDATTQLADATPSEPPRLSLRLWFADREVGIPVDRHGVIVGRDRTCDVVVIERTASRRHARIERRGGQYFVLDESTNGTYLLIEGNEELLLRRDQAMLRGRGQITFGVPGALAQDRLMFECG